MKDEQYIEVVKVDREQYIEVVKIERIEGAKHFKVPCYGTQRTMFAKHILYHLADGTTVQTTMKSSKLKDLEPYIERAVNRPGGRSVVVVNGTVVTERMMLHLM